MHRGVVSLLTNVDERRAKVSRLRDAQDRLGCDPCVTTDFDLPAEFERRNVFVERARFVPMEHGASRARAHAQEPGGVVDARPSDEANVER